jgi:PAS domain S-box-containing protein
MLASIDLQLFQAMPGNSALLLPDAPHFTIIAASEGFFETSGRSFEELVGKGLFEAFPNPPGDEENTSENRLRDSLQQVLQKKDPHSLPLHRYDIPLDNGSFTERYWSTVNKPVLNEAGEVIYIIHSAEDVTFSMQLQQAQKELDAAKKVQESEARFRSLLEVAPVGISIFKGQELIIDIVNPTMLGLWGKGDGKGILGKPFFDVMPELKQPELVKILADVYTSGKAFQTKESPADLLYQGQWKRGYYDFSFTPLFDAEGNVYGILNIGTDVTEQVLARKKVDVVNQELQFVTDTMPQLVWAAEADGYAYFFNKGWLDYTDLTLEEVKGNGWAQSLHPDDVTRTIDAWTHAFRDGAAYEIEYRLKRYDGEYRWFLTRGTPMKDADGHILKWYGTTTDVHEQRGAAEDLQQSIERFNLVAKATQDAIWDWNLITNDIWWNEGFKALFGYKEEEIEPTVDSWYNRVHPEDKDWVVGGIHEVIDSGGKNWSAEYRFRRKDGSYSIVFDRGYAIHDADGKPCRMLGSMQDITERKQAVEGLLTAHERISDILESTTDAFYALDADFNFTYINKRAAQLWDRDRDTLIGKHYWTEFPKAVGTESYHKHYKVLTEREPAHYETVSPLLGVWIDTSIYPGRDGGLSVFFRDITARKEGQVELERKVKERTVELDKANEALQKSNEELIRLNKNLEQFAYAASHDLKEPTRKIHIFSERLKESLGERITESEKNYFSRMELASKRMSTLIDDLLSYSEVSQKVILEEEVDLNYVIDAVLGDLDLEIEEKRAVVTVAKLFVYKGHRRHLQQAFQNLLSNALKYSKPGMPPVISISCSKVHGNEVAHHLSGEAQSKDYYLVTVRDNGIGFEQEDADRIFNVFTRLHGMAEYKGTGVGLSIVRKVIENHQGHIWAESAPGEGSAFFILLPMN